MQSTTDRTAQPVIDRNGLEVLDLATCLELAASVPVARVAVNASGSPLIVPVSHTLVGSRVAFRSASGSKFDSAIMHAPTTVEVDHWDAVSRTGWSVLFIGTSEPVDDLDLVATLDRQADPLWIAQPRQTEWVIVRPDRVSGRRILSRAE